MILETVKLALRTLRANPFRTLLTMLSVTIGTFSIVVMLSLAQSGHKTLSRAIESIGGARKRQLRVEELLDSFDRLRSGDLVDESAADMVRRLYV